jgi:hypothetical protein
MGMISEPIRLNPLEVGIFPPNGSAMMVRKTEMKVFPHPSPLPTLDRPVRNKRGEREGCAGILDP